MTTHASTNNVSPLPQRLAFRGLEVDLQRCTPRHRQAIEANAQGSRRNPLEQLEALEETTLAQASAQLANQLIVDGWDDASIEDALASLNAHLGEHFTQRKLVRLYER